MWPRDWSSDVCSSDLGSMIEYDTEIVERFLELLPSFHGERIALSIFNNTSRTVFPLTDDYTLVEEQLTEAARSEERRVGKEVKWGEEEVEVKRRRYIG